MILKICIELKFDDNLMEALKEKEIDFGKVEDLLCEDIVKVVEDELSDDITLNDCYPVGWDV